MSLKQTIRLRFKNDFEIIKFINLVKQNLKIRKKKYTYAKKLASPSLN